MQVRGTENGDYASYGDMLMHEERQRLAKYTDSSMVDIVVYGGEASNVTTCV